AVWIGWGIYASRTTARIEYRSLGWIDGVELRRYPALVTVETVAEDRSTAFSRLYRYITGANDGGESIAMTAPVKTVGERMEMTAPLRTEVAGSGVRMAFYLPTTYAPETAPTPTERGVSLTVEAPRQLAVRRFSWFATPNRTLRATERLREALASNGIEPTGDPFVMQYDPPWTPPFLRRNEVAIPIRSET
ncbi:MAG: SOUL family heme-binding protein, partial [Halobacteriota archaeon]